MTPLHMARILENMRRAPLTESERMDAYVERALRKPRHVHETFHPSLGSWLNDWEEVFR